jgi:serine palmitoyltransferase
VLNGLPKKDQKNARQYAPLLNKLHKVPSTAWGPPEKFEEAEPPLYFLMTTYISYLIFIVLGHIRDFFGKRFAKKRYAHLQQQNGYAPLNSDFDNFYVRRLKMRINDCFSRPTTGVPGRYITLLDRESNDYNLHWHFTGEQTDCLNMSSYNYLGYAESVGACADDVEQVVHKVGLSSCATRSEAGTLELHDDLEKLVARFIGKPAASVFSQGFGVNATIFSALVSKGCLVISDELNHASIRWGSRLSGAAIRIFKHNDMDALEKLLREVISQGQPRTHRPWKKILVVVEGLYSMEGTMCDLPGLIALKERYKFYLFVDEAHSIGALGRRGRGVCDFYGISPDKVDILMGTFTKSFGAAGGYIAGNRHMIDALRLTNAGSVLAEAMSPIIIQQINTSLRSIALEIPGLDGVERVERLAFNSIYLRLGLKKLGFIIYGHACSPIIPLLLYNPAKMPAFSHEMLKRRIAVVIVGYPATPLVQSRVRFCVSAAHNKDDLDMLLEACDEVGDLLQLKYKGAKKLKGNWKQDLFEEVRRDFAGPGQDAKHVQINGGA